MFGFAVDELFSAEEKRLLNECDHRVAGWGTENEHRVTHVPFHGTGTL